MKTIKLMDITDVKAEDVQPGMILAEGAVIRTERQVGGGKRRDTIFIYTAAEGHTGWVYAGDTVQVYAKLAEALVEPLVKAYKA